MPKYTIAKGDCLSSIAEKFGFLPDTIWNHGENADLKARRKDPNVLYPGDVLFIPEKTVNEIPKPVDGTHSFVKKSAKAKLKLRLMDGDQPRANVPYDLNIDGKWLSGTTDGGGYLEHPIPPGAQQGKLLVGDGPTKDVHEFRFGTVDPVDTDSGAEGRLRDLAYDVDGDREAAIRAFQKKEGMEPTGQLDDATRQKLLEVFGQ
jgi:Putative peptidoglycan binding domain/LysM domain